jgi:simple sugar transport system substrate-binding protein
MKVLHSSRYLRATAVAVTVALVIAAAGWSTSAKSTAKTAGPIDVGVGKITPRPTKRIAYFVQASQAYSYTVAQANAAKAAGIRLGYKVDVFWSNLNPAVELSGFRQAISGGKYAGIIIHPVTSQLCVPVRDLAIKNKVLVLVVGNPMCDDGTGSGETLWAPGTIGYVGGQNNVPGISLVLAAANKLNKGPQKALFVMGIEGHPSVVAWQTAWEAFAAKNPRWQLADTIYTDFTTPTAFTKTSNALSGNKGVTAIFSPYIDITAGVVNAVARRNLTKKVGVFENGGGSTVAWNLVNSGGIRGDLPVYPGSLGSTGVQVMVDALKGKQPKRFLGNDGNAAASKLGVITKANASKFTPEW